MIYLKILYCATPCIVEQMISEKMLFYHKPWKELMFQLASTPWTLLRVAFQSAIVASLTKKVEWEENLYSLFLAIVSFHSQNVR